MNLTEAALLASIAGPVVTVVGVAITFAFKRGHDEAKLTAALKFIDEARLELKKIPEIVVRLAQTQEFYERLHSEHRALREKVYKTREEMISQHELGE